MKKRSKFELSVKQKEIINYQIVAALFRSIFKDNIISKKEYDSLISILQRTVPSN